MIEEAEIWPHYAQLQSEKCSRHFLTSHTFSEILPNLKKMVKFSTNLANFQKLPNIPKMS